MTSPLASPAARLALAPLLLAAAAGPAAAGDGSCHPAWIPTFGGESGMDAVVRALAEFDDGSGAALFVGGDFAVAGGDEAARIARWDGQAFHAVGGGIDAGLYGGVYALQVFDDGLGGGPALYAAGSFQAAGGQPASNIAKWDGQGWSPLSTGLDDVVNALAVFDDGGGPALYAGGRFDTAGGVSARGLARWDGSTWSSLSDDTVPSVNKLAVFDDGAGGGPSLYVGGGFGAFGGIASKHVARWNGQVWSAVGGLSDDVNVLHVHDDGSGPALFAGGQFYSPSRGIARWDGQMWSSLDGGFFGPSHAVYALASYQGELIAGGSFTSASAGLVSRVARWTGTEWGPLGSGVGATVLALAAFDDGSALGGGPSLFAGGPFETAGGQTADHVASWDGSTWDAKGGAIGNTVLALTSFDDGSGDALYAGGRFLQAGEQVLNRVGRWDGQWAPLGAGMDDEVNTLVEFDDGSGPALYAGGRFTKAGGPPARRVARWNGQSWSKVGGGMKDGYVQVLEVFDDGTGPALYAGGSFTTAGGQPAGYIARWDGQTWSPVGGGMSPVLTGAVRTLHAVDAGEPGGPALYAGGLFDDAGGVEANNVARWDGASWSALGVGVSSWVNDLTFFDDGGGPELYATGTFLQAGGQSVFHLARWDGAAWSGVGSGFVGGWGNDLLVYDDGSGFGSALYVGGIFNGVDGMSALKVARWDGASWDTLAGGIATSAFGNEVFALHRFADPFGGGPQLYVGGNMDSTVSGDVYLTRWGCEGAGIDDIPGCFGNPATLSAVAGGAAAGEPFELSLTAAAVTSGVGLLFAGSDGTDASGCGLYVPGIGELILSLAPTPTEIGAETYLGGSASFVVPVPDQPALIGVDIALHGAALGVFTAGVPIELSNGLEVAVLAN
ncbi:MAG: hypothetical protein AAF682_19830 [Planctomycetota bacterium]